MLLDVSSLEWLYSEYFLMKDTLAWPYDFIMTDGKVHDIDHDDQARWYVSLPVSLTTSNQLRRISLSPFGSNVQV